MRTRIPNLLSADHDSPAERPLEALNGSGPASEDRTHVEEDGTTQGRKYAGINHEQWGPMDRTSLSLITVD